MTSPYATWTEQGYPATIEFSPAILERLRRRAVQGLMALPKTGLGLGGILLGHRDAATDIIRVEDFLEFACSHLAGPSFCLTPDERERAVKTIRDKRTLTVVGWYFTRTQPPMAPRAADLDLYETFCPGPVQFMLIMRPGNSEPTKATVFYRDSAGQVTQGAVHDVPLWVASEEASSGEAGNADPGSEGTHARLGPAVPFVTPDLPTGAHGFQPVRTYKLVPRKSGTPTPVPELLPEEPPVGEETKPIVPEPVQPKPAVGAPAPLPTPKVVAKAAAASPRRRWLLIGSIAAAVIAVTALATSSLWLGPSLRLELSESAGHITVIWNGDSVKSGDQGSLSVTDSDQKSMIPLSSSQAKAGVVGFDAKTGKISVVLKIGGQEATAKWTAPDNWAPPQRDMDTPKPKP